MAAITLPNLRRRKKVPEEKIYEAFAKAIGTVPPATRQGKNIDIAQLVKQTAMGLAPVVGKTPDNIEAALIAQGMDWARPFSPGTPLRPWWEYDGQPRMRDYTPGSNVSNLPRSDRLSFPTLTALNDSYDVAGICHRHIISDMLSMPVQFTAADGVHEDVSEDIEKAKAFWRRPDGKRRWRRWFATWWFDVLRYDAGAIYKRRSNDGKLLAPWSPGYDPLQGWGLPIINGPMLLPLVDFDGDIPSGDAPGFVQFVQGMAWDWLTADDLVYEPFSPMSNTPYGLPPIETVILNANLDLRFQWHFLNYFTQGNVPDGFLTAPPDMTSPDQVEQWQQYWDAVMLGDQDKLRQLRFVPHETTYIATKSSQFDEKFPEYLMRRTVAAHMLTPNDLGFTENVNKSVGETQTDVQFRISTLPRTGYVEDFMDEITQDELHLRVKCRFDTGREKEDRLAEAQAWDIWIKNGAASTDEAREQVLGLPVNPEEMTARFVMARTGLVLLRNVAEIAGQVDPETGAPIAGSVVDISVPGYQIPTSVPPAPGATPPGLPPATPPATAGPAPLPGQGGGSSGATADGGGAQAPEATSPTAKGGEGGGLAKSAAEDVTVGGLVVRAADTGRVLMLQRAITEGDPAAGKWEFPGGHLEGDETPLDGALREWSEEVGQLVPDGDVVGSWTSGCYGGFVYEVDSESSVPIKAAAEVINPDDPDGDCTEAVAWWSVSDAVGMPGLRAECHGSPWDLIAGTMTKAVTAGVTSATGIAGADLVGATELAGAADDDDDELDEEELTKALEDWRINSRRRLERGRRPRIFADLPAGISVSIWHDLKNAQSAADVDAVFVKAGHDPGKVRGRPTRAARTGRS